MENKIKVSVVSYLNSKPFVHGLQQSTELPDIELALDTPAICAQKLITGHADIGLVPVASIPKISDAEIVTEYCISSNGEVASVLLLSEVPLKNIESVLLDYQSMTSVTLVKVLSKELWNISPQWHPSTPGFEQTIAGTQAAVVIGDRALEIKSKFRYVYDLSLEWKKLTGLPFVFACWIANKKLPEAFIQRFSSALKSGVATIENLAVELQDKYPASFHVKEYLTKSIEYNFTEDKRKALHLFLEKVKTL